MEPTGFTRSPPRRVPSPPLLGPHLGLIAVLLGLAAGAWLVTDERMHGMDAGPGTDLGSLGFYVSAWVVMMAAMMFPSIAPMVLAYARIRSTRLVGPGTLSPAHWTAFVAGYLLVWTVFGLCAYGLFALGEAVSLDLLAWDRGGPYVAGGVLALAGVYELTPAKNACLKRCRGPFAFLTSSWRDGRSGAVRMGATTAHGASAAAGD
jgi:predicted metal-binding membrane protein